MERNRERRDWDDRKKKQGQSDHLYTDNTVDVGRHRIGISDRTVYRWGDMGIFADGSDKPVGRCGDDPDSGDEDSQSAARQVTEWCGAR